MKILNKTIGCILLFYGGNEMYKALDIAKWFVNLKRNGEKIKNS